MQNDEFKLLVLDRISEMIEELADDEIFIKLLLEDLQEEGLEPDDNKAKKIIRELAEEILDR